MESATKKYLAEKIAGLDEQSRGYDEIGHDWGDYLWWLNLSGNISTAPARWDGPSTKEVWEAESEIKSLDKEIEDLKDEIQLLRSAPKKGKESKDPTENQEFKLKTLNHEKDKMQKIVDKRHLQYSDAKIELDQLVHGRLHLEDGSLADSDLHGYYEERTGTLTWTNGKHKVLPQGQLPVDLLEKLTKKFKKINQVLRF